MKIAGNFLRPRALLLAVLFSSLLAAAESPPSPKSQYLVYVGTYTEDNTGSKGIYAYRYDEDTRRVTPLGLAAETTNPSWIAIHPNGRFLYAVNEVGNYKGPNSGGVSAFSIDRDGKDRDIHDHDRKDHTTGKLTFLNEVRSKGADPCYITIDKTGKWALVANYTGGSVAVFPVLEDGKLGEASDFVQHTGHGPNPKRQESPHAHSINLSPDNRFAFVDDLGLDELLVYKFDSARGTLTPNDPPFVTLDAGAGPRHFALHPAGKFAYVINEMQATVTVLSADLTAGRFRSLQTITTLPPESSGEKQAAEIEVHTSGKFLYASNRGQVHDTIAVFSVDSGRGTLTPIEWTSTQGQTPRSFEIDPTGRFLFAANQKSDDIEIFPISQKTGSLRWEKMRSVGVASPVCVKFLAVE